MKFKVEVRLKEAILDPQGKAVLQALHHLGYHQVKNVRIGKLIELEVEGEEKEALYKKVEEFSRKLLTNPLMETFFIVTDENHRR
ncbi:MAG: phosphoribosylformylglycinamidine synthase subunit PurS [bacterium]